MIKSSTGRLYALLSACKPNDQNVKKHLLLSEILESKEYKALQVNPGAQYVMDKYYGPDTLSNLPTNKLEQVKTIIPALEDCINKLYAVILYGDTSVIDDLYPDFYNANSFGELYRRVLEQPQEGINITNISEIEIWDYFDDSTVKTLNGRLRNFPEKDYDLLEVRIPGILAGEKYCITSTEINARRNHYHNRFRGLETQRIRLQIVENKAFALKSVVSFVLTFGMLVSMVESVELISNRMIGMFIYFVALILYWIVG